MPIVINLDVMLAKRKMTMTQLSEKSGVNMASLSILKSGKARGVRFVTLDAICSVLECNACDVIEITDAETYRKLYNRDWSAAQDQDE